MDTMMTDQAQRVAELRQQCAERAAQMRQQVAVRSETAPAAQAGPGQGRLIGEEALRYARRVLTRHVAWPSAARAARRLREQETASATQPCGLDECDCHLFA